MMTAHVSSIPHYRLSIMAHKSIHSRTYFMIPLSLAAWTINFDKTLSRFYRQAKIEMAFLVSLPFSDSKICDTESCLTSSGLKRNLTSCLAKSGRMKSFQPHKTRANHYLHMQTLVMLSGM